MKNSIVTIVPRKVFFFWGNSCISWLRYMTLYSFRKCNPDWDMTLYIADNKKTEKSWIGKQKQDFFSYVGENYSHKILDLDIKIVPWEFGRQDEMGPSHQSNFLKWEKLYTEGGIYSDMDILWIKPIDDLYEKLKNSDVGITFDVYLSIGLLSGKKFTNFYEHMRRECDNLFYEGSYQSAGVEVLYTYLLGKNKRFVTKSWDAMCKRYLDLKFYNIEMKYIYPWKFNEMHEVFVATNDIPDDCLGIHWYAGSALSQQLNSMMNETNFKDVECTLSKAIERIL